MVPVFFVPSTAQSNKRRDIASVFNYSTLCRFFKLYIFAVQTITASAHHSHTRNNLTKTCIRAINGVTSSLNPSGTPVEDKRGTTMKLLLNEGIFSQTLWPVNIFVWKHICTEMRGLNLMHNYFTKAILYLPCYKWRQGRIKLSKSNQVRPLFPGEKLTKTWSFKTYFTKRYNLVGSLSQYIMQYLNFG